MRRRIEFIRANLLLHVAESFQDVCWRPAADVYRTPAGWLLKFELAGVRPEDIELEVRGNRVTLRGVRRDWLLGTDCQYHSLEIAYSSFERTLELPVAPGRAPITTEYQAGMLLVHIRTEEERTHERR